MDIECLVCKTNGGAMASTDYPYEYASDRIPIKVVVGAWEIQAYTFMAQANRPDVTSSTDQYIFRRGSIIIGRCTLSKGNTQSIRVKKPIQVSPGLTLTFMCLPRK
jgi:hypothetical protein